MFCRVPDDSVPSPTRSANSWISTLYLRILPSNLTVHKYSHSLHPIFSFDHPCCHSIRTLTVPNHAYQMCHITLQKVYILLRPLLIHINANYNTKVCKCRQISVASLTPHFWIGKNTFLSYFATYRAGYNLSLIHIWYNICQMAGLGQRLPCHPHQ